MLRQLAPWRDCKEFKTQDHDEFSEKEMISRSCQLYHRKEPISSDIGHVEILLEKMRSTRVHSFPSAPGKKFEGTEFLQIICDKKGT